MPKKAGDGKAPAGKLSGIAATLFPLRDKVAPLDTPEFRKNAGKLIAGAARPGPKPPRVARKGETAGE